MRRWLGDLGFMLLDGIDAAAGWAQRTFAWGVLLWSLGANIGIAVGLGIITARAVLLLFGAW